VLSSAINHHVNGKIISFLYILSNSNAPFLKYKLIGLKEKKKQVFVIIQFN